ncbi:MAG TPA: CHRD domain-containing protein [Trinickia sp.]|jgi:hypothetical protein|uniref:CHRD domain-containing protein n=1 Tax=Trinickia sp. TaxID=2571163 RepID=UPI002C9077D7|nr:CHRD domain-containing protein [Trinickia sp.]HTI19011.1 CHRD domain-containing protein [Trinickia sp.]
MRAMRKVSAALLMWGLATGVTFADQVVYKAQMTPSSEVPPTTSHGAGEVTATLDTSSKQLTWQGDYHKLTGPATMAHFHGPAPVGQNAGIQIPIDVAAKDSGKLKGEATLTDSQINDLESGKWYVNVHTAKYPGGEIRGQLMPAKSY